MIERGDRLTWGGHTVEVLSVLEAAGDRFDVILKGPAGLTEVTLSRSDVAQSRQPTNDGLGSSAGAIAGLWGKWMEWATPRIRSAATATKPVKPYAHQDDAVFVHMLPQPRLRFLLADEPGTGKTITTGMYIVEGRRRRVVPGKVLIIAPAHLVSKWLADLACDFGIDAERLESGTRGAQDHCAVTSMSGSMSVDLFTHRSDALRKVAGQEASWSLVVFDEAHRLTPTSQYLGAAREISRVTHHLRPLTATPHRGKEWYFQSLFNLLSPDMYPVTAGPGDTDPERRLRPGALHFLRRMKEDLHDHNGNKLFKERFAETLRVQLSGEELVCYNAVMNYVEGRYDTRAVLAQSIYGKRALSVITAAAATLRRRRLVLSESQAGQTRSSRTSRF